MIAAIDIIYDDLNDEPDSDNMVVSFDFEWPIYYFCRVKGKIIIAQIGENLSNEKSHRLVLPFGCHTNNWQFLIRIHKFLAQVYFVFTERMIANGIDKLKKYHRSVSFYVSNVVDIGKMDIHI